MPDHPAQQEEGIEVPYDRDQSRNPTEHDRGICHQGVVRPERFGVYIGAEGREVLRQLKDQKAKIVFDFTSGTSNVVVSR